MTRPSILDQVLTSAGCSGETDPGDRPRFAVTDPATGACLGHVPDMGRSEVLKAVRSAKVAFPVWSRKTAKERAAILRRWFELIHSRADDLAQLLTLEQGKPFNEARGEILYGASYIEWFAEEAKRIDGDILPTTGPDRRMLVLKQPIGVVAAITPWNFPSAMISRKLAPALAAGCTVVIKPAEDTPLSALALAQLARQAGLPDGALNVVTSLRAAETGEVLTSHPDIRKLSFTGSTRVGKLLMRQCAETVKKVSLELGGNAPFIVFEDADLDAAAAGAMLCKFRNAGQTCVSANRFYVHASVLGAFADKLAERMTALKVGEGLDEDTTVGPLINPAAIDKVEGLVKDAVAKGARARLGGGRHARGGNFFEPTVLENLDDTMEIARAEIFGPVVTLIPFEEEADAIQMANDTPYGLAAYFYTQNMARIWRVTEALEYGMVGLNESVLSGENAPFGGMKESGIGREGSKYGIEEYVEMKYLCHGGLGA